MICPVCFGRKYDFKKDGNSGYFVECKKCHGTGIVDEQTNEEWLNSLDTEEKANVLYKMINDGLCGLCKWDCRERCFVHTEEDELKVICDWLKEVHKE